MRLLLVSDYPLLGGGERLLLRWALTARDAGIHVSLLTWEGPLAEAAAAHGLDVIAPPDGAASLIGARVMRRTLPDVCHVNSYGSLGRSVAWSGRRSGIPVVVSASWTDFPGGVRSRVFSRLITLFVAPSRYVAERMIARGVPRERITVLPAVPRRDELPEPKRPPLSDPSAPVVGWVGRLDPIKRLEDAIDAVGLLRRDVPGARLRALAPPVSFHDSNSAAYERDIARRMAESDGACELLPATDDIWRFLDDIDIFLLTSDSETFSQATVEAMAAGRPVVATRAGAVPELIDHERDGLLTSVRDVPGLAAAMGTLVRDPDAARRMGASARDRAVALVEANDPSDKLIGIYRDLAARKRRGGGDRRAGVIAIGPTPPPHHGVSVYPQQLLGALDRLGLLAGHLDTRDPRPVETIGRLDLRNVWLALAHSARILRLVRATPGASVYLPISQARLGFLRDALFVAIARAARRPVIAHLHGGGFEGFYRGVDPITQLTIRRTLAAVDQAWVLTPSLRSMFHGLVAPERIHVLENVVADPVENGVPPGRDGRGPESLQRELRVLYLSNLLPEKGCFDLLDAVAALGERAAGWQVRLAGEADQVVRDDVRRRAERLGERGVQVDLAGSVLGAEKADCWRWADVFVLPTRYRYEGQPLALLEAMGAGLAVVTTARAGIMDTVRDGEEALIVRAGDVDGLGAALERLAADPELRARLGSAARMRYESQYRPERLERDLERLLGGGAVS